MKVNLEIPGRRRMSTIYVIIERTYPPQNATNLYIPKPIEEYDERLSLRLGGRLCPDRRSSIDAVPAGGTP